MRHLWLAVALLAFVPTPILAEDYELPPYTAAYEPSTVDERGMWMEADEYERRLSTSELLVRDEELTAYVRSVLCDVVGNDRCNGVRIYVMRVPAFNATMLPNGAMTVWSGLLLRARNEAELGAVLGHEFAHFELRHSLKGFQRRRSASDVLAWASVLGGIAAVDTRDAQISLIGSVFQFNRDQEKEADLLGLRYLAQSEYPSRSASEIWQHLLEEEDARLAGRKLHKRHRYRAGFFDTHPTDLDRADYLLAESIKVGGSGRASAVEYQAKINPYLSWMLADQIKLNDFGGTDYILNGIASTTGWTGQLMHSRAEMYASRGNPRDLVTATTFYLNALDAGYRDPQTLRGLGLSLIKSGNKAEGGEYLMQYLEALPDAPDANVIRLYLPKGDSE